MGCLWCGVPFDTSHVAPGSTPPSYCRRSHAQQMRKRRARLSNRPIITCPKPYKRGYGYRGHAITTAWKKGIGFYDCVCGAYHLTSVMDGTFDHSTPLAYYQAGLSNYLKGKSNDIPNT